MPCEFLLAKQCPDGGWGESYLSCQDKARSPPWHLWGVICRMVVALGRTGPVEGNICSGSCQATV